MKAIYDPDAVLLTRSIYASLRMRGFPDWAETGITLQAEIENEVFEGTSDLRRRFAEGEYLRLLQHFLPLFRDNPAVFEATSLLIDRLQSGDASARVEAEGILRIVMQSLDEGTERHFETPLNLLVALDVLFRVTVLPRRMASEVKRVFRGVLQSEVSVCDERGEEIRLATFEAEAQDAEFFGLLRMVVERWDLRTFVRQVHALNRGVESAHRPEELEAGIRSIAAKRIAPMFMELDAA